MEFKTLLNRGDLTFFVSIAVVIVLPVYVHLLPPFIFLWLLFWLWQNNFRMNKKMFSGNKAAILFILFIVFYLWQILGLMYADSVDTGLERIFKRLAFIIFPLVLFYPGEKISKNINLILRIFAVFTFLFLIFCFENALNNSLILKGGHFIFNPHPSDYGWENYFYGFRFSNPVHPSYLSMYVILSILISSESLIKDSPTLFKKLFWIFLIIVFLTVLYLLSSRAAILSIIIIFPAYFIIRLRGIFSKKIVISIFVLLIVVLIGIAKTNSRINYTIEDLSKTVVSESFEKDVRYEIWNSAMGVIKKNLIFGVGTGDASNELKKEFIRRGYTEGYYESLNAHNQFLEVLLENGLVGLLIFVCIIGYMIYMAISERNLIFGSFILIILIFFFFETVLNRLAGITFFPLFSFLLIQVNQDKN